MTNTELLLNQIKTDILFQIKDLDRCVYFEGRSDCDHMFFNEVTNIVSEVKIEWEQINVHNYNFYDDADILKTKTDKKFLLVDWTYDGLTIFRYKIDQLGLQKYKIDDAVLDVKYPEDRVLHYLIFEDDGDSAAFEMYFQALFRDMKTIDNFELLEIIKKKDLLK